MRGLPKVLVVSLLSIAGAWLVATARTRAELSPPGAGAGAVATENGDINGDRVVDLTDAIHMLHWLFRGAPPPVPIAPCDPCDGGASLPGTGQLSCYDGSSPLHDCFSFCPGQDGMYDAGCPPEDRFVDNGDGTIADLCTGLTWQRGTADVDESGDIRPDLDGGDRVRWCDALAYCEALELGGYDDWRLPNVRELQSLVDYGRESPSIDPAFEALPVSYWTSTSSDRTPFAAWVVYFRDGNVNPDDKSLIRLHVRAVRGGLDE